MAAIRWQIFGNVMYPVANPRGARTDRKATVPYAYRSCVRKLLFRPESEMVRRDRESVQACANDRRDVKNPILAHD